MTAQESKVLPNVVVVGGGPAGLATLRRLNAKLDLSKYNLVLVTATPYYTHLPACIRLVVQPTPDLDASVNSVLVPYEGLVPRRCRVIVGRVVKIEEEESHEEGANGNENTGDGEKICGAWGGKKGLLVLDGTDERVKYDNLVLATGSKWEGPLAFPGSRDEVKVWAEEWREKFEKAEDVVIVGGGATGLEFAGEIRDLSKTKRITVVHDQPLLLSDAYPNGFRKAVARNVRRRGITVVLDDSISSDEISEGSTIRTEKGRLLVTDLVISCRGPRPNTDFLSTLGEDILSATGHIRVKRTLQMKYHPRIFAAGDVIDWDEQKRALKYVAHAKIVVDNVISVLKDSQPNALYKGCYEAIVIANGKSGGSTYYSFWGPHVQLGNLPSSIAKARALKGPSRNRWVVGSKV